MFLRLLLGYYIYTRFRMLLQNENDDTFTDITNINLDTDEEFKDVDYINDTNLAIVHNVFH